MGATLAAADSGIALCSGIPPSDAKYPLIVAPTASVAISAPKSVACGNAYLAFRCSFITFSHFLQAEGCHHPDILDHMGRWSIISSRGADGGCEHNFFGFGLGFGRFNSADRAALPVKPDGCLARSQQRLLQDQAAIGICEICVSGNGRCH